MTNKRNITTEEMCRYGLVVSVSTSHAAGIGFVPKPVHTKDHHKNGTNCLSAWHTANRIGVWQCVKDRPVCGAVYGDTHYKDILESILRVGYCIPVLHFYLVLHGF